MTTGTKHDPNANWAVELEPLVEQATESMKSMAGSSDWFVRQAGRLPPELAGLIGKLGPYGVSFLADRIGLGALGPTFGPLSKSFLINLSTKLGAVVADQADPAKRAELAKQKADEVAREVLKETVLKLDDFGNVHIADCPHILRLEFAVPQPQGKRGQPTPPRQRFVSISLETAVSRELPVANCCRADVDSRLKRQAEENQKKEVKDPFADRSPLGVLGQMKPGERRRFDAWLNNVPPEERMRVINALKELDSKAEFVGLMSLPPEIRAEALPLLENRNSLTPVKEFLRQIGQHLLTGGRWTLSQLKRAWTGIKAWDEEHFRQLADRAQERFQEEDVTQEMVVETDNLDRWPTRAWRGVVRYIRLFNPLR